MTMLEAISPSSGTGATLAWRHPEIRELEPDCYQVDTRGLEPDYHQIDQGIGTKESLCLDQWGLGVKLLLLDCHPGTGVLVSDEGDTLLNINIGHHQTICSTIAMVSLLVEIHIPH